MSSKGKKGGGNFFSNAVSNISEPFMRKEGNFFENLLEGTINMYLQGGTGGLVGYQEGKVGPNQGITGEQAVSGIKTVTGAKAAEEANALARENFEKSRADAEAARKEQINQTGRDQLRQSILAGSARKTAAARAGNKNAVVGSATLADEKDFLGL